MNHQYESLVRDGHLLLRSRSGITYVNESMKGDDSSLVDENVEIVESAIESRSLISDQPIEDSSNDANYAEWTYSQTPHAYNDGEVYANRADDIAYVSQTDGSPSYGDYYAAENQEWLDPNLYWEEYFDEGAQAKYWFNTWTGEATWVYPFSVEESS